MSGEITEGQDRLTLPAFCEVVFDSIESMRVQLDSNHCLDCAPKHDTSPPHREPGIIWMAGLHHS